MKLATRAKLKSVSKQFVDNLATRTHTQAHTLLDSHTHCKNTLFSRTLATPVACLCQLSTQCVHSLSHFALPCLLSFLHSLSLCLFLSLLCSLPLSTWFVVLCSFAGNNRRDLAPSSNLVSFHSFALCSASRSIRSK